MSAFSALSYICEYGSNSDDSDCDHNSTSENKKIKLHVPDLSHIAVVPADTHEDNLKIHGGRQRSFPHERGNWASLVYIKHPEEVFLCKLTNKLQEELATFDKACQRCDDIHISLSKTFILKYHLITPFTASLQKVIEDIDSFEVNFDAIKVYCNEEKTRTFIALEVDYFSNKYLSELTQKVDEVLDEYKLPKFYEEPSFHVSLLWINGNKKKEIETILENLNNITQQHLQLNNKKCCINKVNCKIGNKYYQYFLQ